MRIECPSLKRNTAPYVIFQYLWWAYETVLLMHCIFRGYDVLCFLCFSIIVQEENLKDSKPF